MIETVFSWPGIGNYLTTALLNADMNAVLGATLVIGAVFIAINKLSDVLYRVLDPRSALMSLTRDWLLDPSPAIALAGRGSAAATACCGALLRNPLAVAGAVDRASVLIVMALFAPLIATAVRRPAQNLSARAAAAERRALDRHRRARPRHLQPRRLRRADHADDRRAGRGASSAPLGLVVGAVAGYFGGWIDTVLMRITDIFLSIPKLILALAFVAALGPGHRERHHRHRDHLLAGLCAHRAGRDADHPQRRLHRRGRAAGRVERCASSSATSCRSAPPR